MYLARVAQNHPIGDGHLHNAAEEPIALADGRAIPVPTYRLACQQPTTGGMIAIMGRSSSSVRGTRTFRRQVSAHLAPRRGFSSR